MNRKFKRTAFIWNKSFDQYNAKKSCCWCLWMYRVGQKSTIINLISALPPAGWRSCVCGGSSPQRCPCPPDRTGLWTPAEERWRSTWGKGSVTPRPPSSPLGWVSASLYSCIPPSVTSPTRPETDRQDQRLGISWAELIKSTSLDTASSQSTLN